MAGKFVPNIFIGQTNLQIIPINLEITGTFKHEPNPLVDSNLRASCRKPFSATPPDFGVCFDGDADRCIFVDEWPRSSCCDILTAFLAKGFSAAAPGSSDCLRPVLQPRRPRGDPQRRRHPWGRERVGHVFMKKVFADSHGIFGGANPPAISTSATASKPTPPPLSFAMTCSVLTNYDMPLSQILKPPAAATIPPARSITKSTTRMRHIKKSLLYKDAAIDYLAASPSNTTPGGSMSARATPEPLLRLNIEANTADLLKKKLEEVGGGLGNRVAH